MRPSVRFILPLLKHDVRLPEARSRPLKLRAKPSGKIPKFWPVCLLDELPVINLPVPGRFILPDHMGIAGGINGNGRMLGAAQSPGEPLAWGPGGPPIRTVQTINFPVS